MTDTFFNPELWSKFGLAGLLAGSLFFIIVYFIRVTEKKDSQHSSQIDRLTQENTHFIRHVLDEARTEREVINDKFAKSQEKVSESNDRLSGALQELTVAIARNGITPDQKKS